MAVPDSDLDRLLAAARAATSTSCARWSTIWATSRWRGDAVRVGEGSKRRIQELARELGLVTRDEWDELELRVAQLEHRLRLVEDRDTPSG